MKKVVAVAFVGVMAILLAGASCSAAVELTAEQARSVRGGCDNTICVPDQICGSDGKDCGGACETDSDCTDPDNEYVLVTGLWSCKEGGSALDCDRSPETRWDCGPVWDCYCNTLEGRCEALVDPPPLNWQGFYYDCEE